VPKERYVLVIGSSNIDLNIYLERFPNPGETVTGGIFNQSFGGKGANQAVASARAGSKTIFIGNLGQDAFGDQMLKNLNKEGIKTEFVTRDPVTPSGIAIILVNENGQNMISVAPGANEKVTKELIHNVADVVQNASVVIFQMEIPVETILEVVRLSSQSETMIVLNPAPFKPIPIDVLKYIDIITPNENELLKLHNACGFDKVKLQQEDLCLVKIICQDLHSIGVQTIITTLGANGCFVSKSNRDSGATPEQYHVDGIKTNVVDTVGAGDCFNGVLASKLCQKTSLKTAIEYAEQLKSEYQQAGNTGAAMVYDFLSHDLKLTRTDWSVYFVRNYFSLII